MKKFCKDLREHAIKIIDCETKEMISLADEENESYRNQKVYHIWKKSTTDDERVRDHCHFTGKYRGAAHVTCNLNYKLLKESAI